MPKLVRQGYLGFDIKQLESSTHPHHTPHPLTSSNISHTKTSRWQYVGISLSPRLTTAPHTTPTHPSQSPLFNIYHTEIVWPSAKPLSPLPLLSTSLLKAQSPADVRAFTVSSEPHKNQKSTNRRFSCSERPGPTTSLLWLCVR